MASDASSAQKSPQNNSIGLVPRLVRSFSKGHSTTESSTSTATADVKPAASSSQIPRQKLSAVDRFLKYARKEKKLDFPPSSWFVGEGKANGDAVDPVAEPLPPTPQIDEEKEAEVASSIIPDTAEDAEDVPEEAPEPDTLARKIQAMISSLPSSLSATSSRFRSAPASPPAIDTDGPPPTPPPGSSTFADSKLVAFLTSSAIMNGSIERGRQSVWSVLDRLRRPQEEGKEAGGNVGVDPDDDDSSVMMYAPLEPTEGSEVEIALSEIVSVNGDGEEVRTPQRFPLQLDGPAIISEGDPRWKGKQKADEAGSSRVDDGAGEPSPQEAHTGPKPHRVWLPSLTNISVQATWWGFRIYLPPPVLDVLNNKRLEATKRAAMITTALKWLLDHLPIKLVPPQFRPAMTILRRLVPYLGYIGGFVAWSWSAIKTFDKGNGVILTATWLLPIALIPGSWEVDDLPRTDPQTQAQSSSSK
ncbi:hypothetical protein BV22DRAFT_1033891 [Leucogyrophana mollusca]|uniref:Uncharacterized protein n=1 Tax=Leucogyrophana mollusca TaxID=85980 RepID=A0ACB8BIH8_9AGAM|nr:hypothetical protein BV22DRAFT_1033891 [Leucogyrophana mollusca]